MTLNPVQFGEIQQDIHRVSNAYQKSRGQPPIRGDVSGVVMPHGGSRQVYDQYKRIPDYENTPQANASYGALHEEVGRQFDFMTNPRSKGGLGLSAHVTPVDPYGRRDMSQPYADQPNKIMGDMKEDVANGRIQALSTATTGGTESFDNDTNNMFRVVHDLFGHAGANRGIDRHGEEAAYQLHRQMFSPLARGALASELRGQTAHLLQTGSFISHPKRGIGMDTGPLHPQQFGEHMKSLQDEAADENRKQGIV